MQYKNLVFVLWLMCVNYPILKNWKCTIGKPVALVFDDITQAIPFIEMISPHPRIIDFSTKVKTAKDFLLTANSVGVFMMISNRGIKTSLKEQEKINAIFSVASLGLLDGQEANAMAFLVCEKKVPNEYKSSVVELHINTDFVNDVHDMFAFIPPAEQLAVVRDKINGFKRNGFLPFKAAVAFAYPRLNEIKDLERYERMLSEVEALVLQAEEYKELDDVTELVVEQFYKYLNENAREVYLLSEIDSEVEMMLDRILVVKDNYLFMEDRKFKEIVEPIIKVVPIDEIKRQLYHMGFLQGNTGDYTVKLNYYINGDFKRRRMLKFDLSNMEELQSYLINV